MFEKLDEIRWNELEDAYGPAGDAPGWIRALISEDANLRSDAVYHFLHSAVCHQCTVYSATPHVIPFVLEALRNRDISERSVFESGDPLMKMEMLGFLHACSRGATDNDLVGKALLAGKDVYAIYAQDADLKAGDFAQMLQAFCNGRTR